MAVELIHETKLVSMRDRQAVAWCDPGWIVAAAWWPRGAGRNRL